MVLELNFSFNLGCVPMIPRRVFPPTFFQNCLIWPTAYGKSDSMALLELDNKVSSFHLDKSQFLSTLCLPFILYPLPLSLSYPGKANWHIVWRNWNLDLRTANNHMSELSRFSRVQAYINHSPRCELNYIWETQSQNQSAKLLSDSYQQLRDNKFLLFMLLSFEVYYTVVDN